MNEKPRRKAGWKTSIPPMLCAAAVVWMIVSLFRIASDLPYSGISWLAVLIAPLIFLVAAVLLFRDRPAGFGVAILGAALPLIWIFLTESRGYRNSWIAMNASDRYAGLDLPYCELRIITTAVLITTFVWATLRSLPHGWELRHQPVNQRTWPAFLATFVVLSYWFATFAFPYRQPIIIDAMHPEISILHVNKDGTRFHESRISVYRDGTYYLTKSERHLFSYTFKEVSYHGTMTSDLRNQLTAVKAIPALQRTLSKAPGSLRAWHGEGWYTEANSFAITAFTTENTTEAPSGLAAFFHQIEGIPTTTGVSYEIKDVCLGFCYDPKAGLGYRAENQRCSEKSGGRLVCY